MTLKRFLIISLFLFVVNPASVCSEDAKSKLRGGPITVTSDSLTADNKSHSALFEKNVVAKTADMTIHADRMQVYYKEDTGDVIKIEATGDVKLHRDSRVITAGAATYYADEEKVVFTGDPRAVDGENIVTGTAMTYFLRDDRSYVEHSKVFLKGKKDK